MRATSPPRQRPREEPERPPGVTCRGCGCILPAPRCGTAPSTSWSWPSWAWPSRRRPRSGAAATCRRGGTGRVKLEARHRQRAGEVRRRRRLAREALRNASGEPHRYPDRVDNSAKSHRRAYEEHGRRLGRLSGHAEGYRGPTGGYCRDDAEQLGPDLSAPATSSLATSGWPTEAILLFAFPRQQVLESVRSQPRPSGPLWRPLLVSAGRRSRQDLLSTLSADRDTAGDRRRQSAYGCWPGTIGSRRDGESGATSGIGLRNNALQRWPLNDLREADINRAPLVALGLQSISARWRRLRLS